MDIGYSPETDGELKEYLRKCETSCAGNVFYGPEHYFSIRDKGLMIPGFTCVRMAQSLGPDEGYFVNSEFMLESRVQGEYNMSFMGGEKGVYDPNELLKDKLWSIHWLDIFARDMAAALIIQNKKILLVHNTKHSRLRIEPPGGKREDDETLEECVVREVEEELGIRIRPAGLFGAYETESPEGEFKVFIYCSKIVKGSPRIKEPEKISDFGWYSAEDIEKFEKKGTLVPNLFSAMEKLQEYL